MQQIDYNGSRKETGGISMTDGGKCNRCGKQRVLLKSWKETVATWDGTSELSYAQYVCPDDACQKLNDKALKLLHEQHAAREQANLEREQVRNELRRTKKVNAEPKE